MRNQILVLLLAALSAGAAAEAAPLGAPRQDDQLKQRMAAYYAPVRVPDFRPEAPQTPLPLNLEKLANWSKVKAHLAGAAGEKLSRNGFVVTDKLRLDQVHKFYDVVKQRGLPIFVTSDSLLHLYHIQFDETLREVEEKQFFGSLTALTQELQRESEELYDSSDGRTKEAARRCVAYFTVAHRLLEPAAQVPAAVKAEVEKEIRQIKAHQGFMRSPVFHYKEDYSQYVPRGHYTRSEKLKRYFKAMMWYGRMAFLIKGKTPRMPNALISDEEARTQTLAALLISSMLGNQRRHEVWNGIYAITAYYVGFADDLTPREYQDVWRRMPMRARITTSTMIEQRWLDMQKALAALRSPEIYGGTGDMEGPPPRIATEADLDKALEATKGMRFMGRRYVPDSYMMGRLVYPSVGAFNGKGRPFTLFRSMRAFPRGLDVMAVLGSDRAREILTKLGDAAYERYDEQLNKLRAQFGRLSKGDWNRNMYWSWLYCLGALLEPAGAGYPAFMRSDAWADKQLNAALGSWAQLRHDTILYAKQSYTMRATAMPMRPRMVEGYVEPVPEFYARLLALTRMTIAGLEDMRVLDDRSRRRLQALERVVRRLLEISIRELRNERLSREDYQFIRSFGVNLRYAVAGVKEDGLETTIVADVHTDGNSGQVLEEGTGFLRTVMVAYPMPDGGTVVGFGPVFSYYEFKQPMSNRLTDEAWKQMLRNRTAPKLPQWTHTFSAGR